MKGKKLVATVMLSTLLFTGCGMKDSNAVIKINGTAISQSQFDKTLDETISSSPFASMVDKSKKDDLFYLTTAQRVLNQMIIETLLEQEVKERGIKVTKDDMDKALAEVVEQVGGKDEVVALLKQNGISTSKFKKDLKQQVKMKKLADSVANTEVTDKDCETFYKKNVDKFKHPELVRASHILLLTDEAKIAEAIKTKQKEIKNEDLQAAVKKEVEAKKELAEKLAKELQADNTKFAAYAKKYSEDPGSAERGGDLGFFPRERMVPEFSKVAFTNKPNTVSEPVKSQFGYHIILVQDRKEAGVDPYEKVQSRIKDVLATEKRAKALDDLVEAAKKKATIEYKSDDYNPEVIQKKLDVKMDSLTNGAYTKEKAKKNNK